MKALALSALAVVVGAGAVFLLLPSPKATATPPSPFQKADQAYSSGKVEAAIEAYQAFEEQNQDSPDAQTQDAVSSARIRLAYAYAKKDDFQAAKAILKKAEENHKGTDKFDPESGSIPDQASYQAAICDLNIEQSKGIKALKAHIDKYPDSPTVYSALKRLQRILSPADFAKIQDRVDRRAAERADKARLAESMCGPLAVAELLRLVGKEVPSETKLVEWCGTTAVGTHLAGMKRALQHCEVPAFAYQLNHADFKSMPLPALWLRGEHYLVIRARNDQDLDIYDPLDRSTRREPMPEADSQFLATVLTLTKLELPEGN